MTCKSVDNKGKGGKNYCNIIFLYNNNNCIIIKKKVIYVCMYACMHIYMYMYIYRYTHMQHIHINRHTYTLMIIHNSNIILISSNISNNNFTSNN